MLARHENASQNFILNSLDSAVYERIYAKLIRKDLPLTQFLYNQGGKIEHIYFPETSVVSIVTNLSNGNAVETGIIGKEGVAGAYVILGSDTSPSEATIQLAGEILCMTADDFKMFFAEEISFQQKVLQYLYLFIAQISQNSVCLCHHLVEHRLARWLLMFQDRADSDKLNLTQEFIAQMLGVHRPSVSKNANKLQQLGLIKYNRGKIAISDREGLENFSCECYETLKNSQKELEAKSAM